MEAREDLLVTSFFNGTEWIEVDRFAGNGLAGRFAFFTGRSRMLGRADQLAVRSLTFLPAE